MSESSTTPPAHPTPDAADPSAGAADAPVTADTAQRDALRAAERSAVTVRDLSGPSELRGLTELFTITWGSSQAAVPQDLVVAIRHAGGYVGGAFSDNLMTAAGVGFLGRDPGGKVYLHSHAVGVHPRLQGTGVGLAVKMHQRAWALANGITEIRWTYDPLMIRNASFNVGRLGGLPISYLPDFYGELDDDYNRGDHTDRVVLSWKLDRPLPGRPPFSAAEAVTVVSSDDNAPVVHPIPDAPLLRVEIPAGYGQLRRDSPGTALRWRLAYREVFPQLLDAGYRVVGWDHPRAYLLHRP